MPSPESLIVNPPFVAPTRHWQQARDGTLALVEGRRGAGYVEAWVAAVNAKGGFGIWCSDVAYAVAQRNDVLRRHDGG